MKEFLIFLLLGGMALILLGEILRQLQRQQRLDMLKRSLVISSKSADDVEIPKTFSGRAQFFFRKMGIWLEERKLVSQKTLDTIKIGVGPRVYYTFLGAKLSLFVLGCVLYLFCYLLFDQLVYPIVFPIFGLIAPDMVMSRWRKNYITNVQAGMADALDLMVICVEVGMPAEVAIGRVAYEMKTLNPAVSQELGKTVNDFQVIPDRVEVFRLLSRRTGLPIMKQISSVLVQSYELGTPLGEAFRTLAEESKKETILRFQEKVAQVPALMTIPMIVFILPVLFIALLAPAVLKALAMFGS
ncbi:MAG: type II secretion system F family protein [Acetobacter sp.]|nr:type II secretion system F family protein [Acetobacter sp.]MBQ5515629.1 type II secretion system F family protein [Acetobacter sp.]